MPLTAERAKQAFAEGLVPQAFVAKLSGRNRQSYLDGYAATEFTPEQLAAFAALPAPLAVLALVEEDSGDCLFNAPILHKLSEATGKLELCFLLRPQNLDIAAQYLLRSGHNHVPTYIFYNQAGTEIGTFIERPPFVLMLMAEWLEEFWQAHPDAPDYGALPGQMTPESRAAMTEFFAQRRETYRAQETDFIIQTILAFEI